MRRFFETHRYHSCSKWTDLVFVDSYESALLVEYFDVLFSHLRKVRIKDYSRSKC